MSLSNASKWVILFDNVLSMADILPFRVLWALISVISPPIMGAPIAIIVRIISITPI